ncbi:MAG: hypothetical protein J6B97_08610 [Bacteroidales bacterium]|nr:hypothetical protein [Bacteroidales bacterium]
MLEDTEIQEYQKQKEGDCDSSVVEGKQKNDIRKELKFFEKYFGVV